MNVSTNAGEGGEKRLPEATVQMTAQNLSSIQTVQSTQNVIQSNIQTIQSTQSVVGTVGQSGTLVGKSVSLDLNQKISLAKPGIPSNIVSSTDSNKLTATLCQMSPTLRIISPNIIGNVERQSQPQNQEQQQIVTSIPATYHVPRGPAAVANISTPRATVATPIVRSTSGQIVPISRPGVSTTVANPQWPQKTPYLYVPPQRHPLPIVQRVTTRPAMAAAVYSGGQTSRLVNPAQGRPVQALQTAVVTGVPGVSSAPCRLRAPVLQSNNNIARLPVTQAKPPTPQETVPQISQPSRTVSQSIQMTQTTRTLTTSSTVNRIAVSAPVIGTPSRIASVTSVQPVVSRPVAISTTTAPATVSATVSRIVLPQQQQTVPRVMQTIASVSTLGQVSRVITTAANTASVTRVSQTGPTSVARITGISMHPLPVTPTRTTPTTIKTAPVLNIAQTIQPKQPIQQSSLRIVTTGATNSSNSTVLTNTSPSVQATYSQYRPAPVQPVRLLVEPGYEEPQHKPNASPRPSILRKRDYDSSPAKGVVKNLVPVLASLPLTSSICSPPGSPRADRDGGGCQSSGSTTVSATSSPGLDEEPEQSRINMNINMNISLNISTTVEMSPRKKPRKQQLTGVELTESRCTDEEIQFITEEKIRKEKQEKEKEREKTASERKQSSALKLEFEQQTPVRTRPTPSLLGSSWKNRWGGRLHHYRRPSDVRPREERRPTVAELAQQKHVIQKLNGWKIYHLSAQMEDLAEMEKEVHDKLKATLTILESQQSTKGRHDDGIERTNELIKGNMQRSSLISEGMNEARTQLVAIFQHQGHVRGILERCGNKRAQKKRDK